MSDSAVRRLGILLAGAGVSVAGYLTWIHYAGTEALCVGGGGGCERVQTSDYAQVLGVPVAVLGLAAYLALGSVLLARGAAASLAAAFLSLAGFGFSAYLTYVEIFEIEAICQWCVASALLMTALVVVTWVRAARPATNA